METKYHKNNFHKHTFCVFQEVEATCLKSLDLSYKSKSGSSYYFTAEGVYRESNHWGRAANCRWRLQSDAKNVNQFQRIGYAKWTDFYPNNENDKLFFIEVNCETKEVNFQHKNSSSFSEKYILRTASQTAKVVQQIKEVLHKDNWSKYLYFNDLEELRYEIIQQLLTTETSFIKIKQKYL